MNIRVSLLVLTLFASSLVSRALTAQIPVPSPADEVLLEVPVPPPLPQSAVEEERPAVEAARPDRVTAHEVIGGDPSTDHGSIDFTSTAAGVLLTAKPSWPGIHAKLGAATSTTKFTIFNSANTALFSVRGDGNVGIGTEFAGSLLHLQRSAAGIVGMRIDNPDPGSSAAASATEVIFTENGTYKAALQSIGSATPEAKAAGGPGAMRLINYATAPMLFFTSGLQRMTISANGNIGIGTTPGSSYLMHLVSQGDGVTGLYAVSSTTVEANAAQGDIGAMLFGYQSVAAGATNTGYAMGARVRGYALGSGTVTDTYGLFVDSGVYAGMTPNVSVATGIRINITRGSTTTPGTIGTGYALRIEPVEATNPFAIYQEGANDVNYFAGKIGIGMVPTKALDVVGDAHFTGTVTGGNIKAKYQDVAEWVPSTTDLDPGVVVVLNPGRNNEVMMSATAYDTAVAGVVSAQPGLSLGEEGPGKEQIATTGRVKVRVDARTAAVRVGDLLVTSDIPGTAMRSEPMAINGRRFHQPGTIIGKALEPLEGGVGEILVLLSMQ